MIYEKIQGWFDYADFYDQMINNFDNAIFVEIGAWKGKSISYMAEKIKQSKKNIKFYAVDTFEGNPESEYHASDIDIINGTLYETYLKNIEPIKEFITTIKGDSKEVHRMFRNHSIDFLFIDGSHTYKSVSKDIKLWLPKVKGIVAGHDYHHIEVNKAVNEYLPNHEYVDNVWFFNLKK